MEKGCKGLICRGWCAPQALVRQLFTPASCPINPVYIREWVELRIDYSDEFLERKLAETAQPSLPSQPVPEKPS